MFGQTPPCLFLVYANPGPGGDEALARWYMEVHGPDAFKGGVFHALHRYQAVGDYDARFLAVWEASFASLEEARARMRPAGGARPDRSRITDDLLVVWSALKFHTGFRPGPGPPEVGTMTLVENGAFDRPGTTIYRYGDVDLYESPADPDDVAASWAGLGQEGVAPHGPYPNIFDHPDTWPPIGQALHGPWVSHWRPIGSLRRDDAATRSETATRNEERP